MIDIISYLDTNQDKSIHFLITDLISKGYTKPEILNGINEWMEYAKI